MTAHTQLAKIREALLRGEKITALEALERWGCLRLAARIRDLKDEGLNIDRVMVTVGQDKQVARYALLARAIARLRAKRDAALSEGLVEAGETYHRRLVDEEIKGALKRD